MNRERVFAAILLTALLGEAFFFSPPQRPDQNEWVLRLLVGDWEGEEPWVIVLFNWMGLWPLAMVHLLAGRLNGRPIPLWPFNVFSFFLGAFALLPGLILQGRPTPPGRIQRGLAHPAVGFALMVAFFALFAWGVLAGSPRAFISAWKTEQFVHVMAFDFVAFAFLAAFLKLNPGSSDSS